MNARPLSDGTAPIYSPRVNPRTHIRMFAPSSTLPFERPYSQEDIINMNAIERRLAERFSLKIPLRVRILKSASQEQRAESRNLSTRGIYFATNLPLREGTPVHVTFEMPEEVAHKMASEWRCTGHVVHVQPSSSLHEEICVGVAFDCYEILPAPGTSMGKQSRSVISRKGFCGRLAQTQMGNLLFSRSFFDLPFQLFNLELFSLPWGCPLG